MTLLLAFGTAQSFAAEPLTYNFVKFPPFQYQPERRGSRAEGLTIDLLRAASSEIGLPLLYQQVPPQRLIKTAAAGQMQLSLVSSRFIAPMGSLYLCSNTPLSKVTPTLYVNRKLHPNIMDPKDLTDELVYAPYSTSNSLFNLLPATINQDDSNKDTIVSSLFSKGRAGLVVNFKENMQPQLAHSPPDFAYQAFELITLDIVLCINKSIDNYKAIHASLERAILQIANSETGQAIYHKHQFYLDFIATPSEPETDSGATIQ